MKMRINWLAGAMAVLLLMPFPVHAQSVQELQTEIKNTRSDIASLQQQIQQLNEENTRLENELNELSDRAQTLQNEETALGVKNKDLRIHLSHVQGAVAAESSDDLRSLGLKPLVDTGSKQSSAKKPVAKKAKTTRPGSSRKQRQSEHQTARSKGHL